MKINNITRFIGAVVLAVSLTFFPFSRVITYAENKENVKSVSYYLNDISLDEETKAFLNKIVSVGKYFYFENGKISINLSKQNLMDKYSFTEKECERLVKTILNKEFNTQVYSGASEFIMFAHIEDGTLYISNTDLKAGTFSVLTTAATAGPAAVAAALTTIASAVSGPVGAILGTILSLAAGPSLVELCGRITYAIATDQGIYIRPVFSYPPLEIGYY